MGGIDEENLAFLEKQLLAVQMCLREEIGEEKRQIAHLLSVLREAISPLKKGKQKLFDF